MKKAILYLMLLMMSLSVFPSTITAKTNEPIAITETPKEVPDEVKVMLTRLDEIKTMDKSAMSRVEKKALRKEVRTIKATLKASNNGVYLSVGAIIIIILLLIILL